MGVLVFKLSFVGASAHVYFLCKLVIAAATGLIRLVEKHCHSGFFWNFLKRLLTRTFYANTLVSIKFLQQIRTTLLIKRWSNDIFRTDLLHHEFVTHILLNLLLLKCLVIAFNFTFIAFSCLIRCQLALYLIVELWGIEIWFGRLRHVRAGGKNWVVVYLLSLLEILGMRTYILLTGRWAAPSVWVSAWVPFVRAAFERPCASYFTIVWVTKRVAFLYVIFATSWVVSRGVRLRLMRQVAVR